MSVLLLRVLNQREPEFNGGKQKSLNAASQNRNSPMAAQPKTSRENRAEDKAVHAHLYCLRLVATPTRTLVTLLLGTSVCDSNLSQDENTKHDIFIAHTMTWRIPDCGKASRRLSLCLPAQAQHTKLKLQQCDGAN